MFGTDFQEYEKERTGEIQKMKVMNDVTYLALGEGSEFIDKRQSGSHSLDVLFFLSMLVMESMAESAY